MVICLISFTLAYYPGETIVVENEMGIDNLVYTIIDNSSEINELNISINSTNISITFPQDMIPNSFTIVFLEEQTREVVQTIRTGGGSTRTKYVDRDVKVYVTEYVDRNTTTEVEVEKIVDRVKYKEEPMNYWYILFALVLGGILMWVVIVFINRDRIEYEKEKYEYDEE